MLQMVPEDEDYPRLQVVVSFMRDASAYVESASEERRNMETLREVEKEFSGTIKLMRQGRHFVRRGYLGKFNRRGNKEDLVFHLFNDLYLSPVTFVREVISSAILSTDSFIRTKVARLTTFDAR